jgi:nucleoside recognition membrane protein YjiH
MMKYWLDSLWGTVISGLILTWILHNIVRYALGG